MDVENFAATGIQSLDHPGYIDYAIPAHIDCEHSVNKHKYQPGVHV